MYTKEEIRGIKRTVAAILHCKEEDIHVAGAQPSKSFILVLSIKKAYTWKLLALTAQERLALLKLKIDYLIVDTRVIYIESSKGNFQNAKTVLFFYLIYDLSFKSKMSVKIIKSFLCFTEVISILFMICVFNN